MNRYQFEVLTYIEKNGKKEYPMRTLSDTLKISGTAISKALDELENEALIKRCEDQMEITERGLEALEPYRVKRAVIMAAGFGSRMVPVTLDRPKPMVAVNGVRIIDTLLDALVSVGIKDITLVRGYKKEKFDEILEKTHIPRAAGGTVFTAEEAKEVANRLGYPVLVRPSYVLGGQGMRIAVSDEDVEEYIGVINQIAQEGAIQIFQEYNTGMEEIIVGVVGVLQFDVLKYRLENEYNCEIRLEPLPYQAIRWIKDRNTDMNKLRGVSEVKKVKDMRGNPLLLFKNEWGIQFVLDRNEGLELVEFSKE